MVGPVQQWSEVLAPSVFLGGELVFRPISTKEKAQLLDIREDWMKAASLTWEGLPEKAAPLPCRAAAEFLIGNFDWWRPEGEDPKTSAHCAEPPSNGVQMFDGRRRGLVNVKEDSGILSTPFPGIVTEPADALNVSKAVKADAARIDTSLWNVGGDSLPARRSRRVMRNWFHGLWLKILKKEAWDWLAKHPDPRNEVAIKECIERAEGSTWFEWKDGSRLFFWRWPEEFMEDARDGGDPFMVKRPKRRRFARKADMEAWVQAMQNDKVKKYVRRRYIVLCEEEDIEVFITVFSVPKGDDDIRVVWSQSETGVNECYWPPKFFVPSGGTMHRRLPNHAWCFDDDAGEMFYNFNVPEEHQKYQGVEIPPELWEELGGKYGKWCRPPMGWRPSPYMACRLYNVANEYAKGDPEDQDNPFAFDRVVLNLPMSPTYDPTEPRVQKLQRDGTPAADRVPYVDDGRGWGADEPKAKKAERRAVSRSEHLGHQDAKRKRREVSQTAGAWAGGVVRTDRGLARKFLPMDRWSKARAHVEELIEVMADTGEYELKPLLKARGFLVYAAMTYDFLTPHLKGLHMTVDSWRKGRDSAGWKKAKNATRLPTIPEESGADADGIFSGTGRSPFTWREPELEDPDEVELDEDGEPVPELPPLGAPKVVRPVPRLEYDLKALRRYLSSPTPLMVPLRPNGCVFLAYGFGDASGEGFGSAWNDVDKERGSLLRRGFWCPKVGVKSSNNREFRNLIIAVMQLHEDVGLEGLEIWLFTDNKVSEMVFWKGSSENKDLFEMMLELRTFCLEHGAILHLVHCAGTRMIAQGTDGLSRGELHMENLLNRELQVVPLHLGAFDRSPGVLDWIKDWTNGVGLPIQAAEPVDWPYKAHFATATWVWAPPPAAALYALEELALARLKRGKTHASVVVIPRLMSPEWFRRFVRSVDLYFTVDVGAAFWGTNMHEPLLIGLSLPYLRHQPWVWKRVGFMVDLGRTLSRLFKSDPDAGGRLLRQFWSAQSRAHDMPEYMVSNLLLRATFRPFLGLSSKRQGREGDGDGREREDAL